MDFQEIEKMKDEFKKVSAIYDVFDEATRLESKAANIEFITSIRYIERYLKKGMKILDLGAGTGRYSLYLASKGYEVTAVELVEKHAKLIKSAKKDNMNLNVINGNALNELKKFKDNSFHMILCFGPLYHLEKLSEREECVREIKRVCTENGKMLFAFINNDMVIATETMCYNSEFLKGEAYDHKTFKVKDFPFVFNTVSMARNLLKSSGLITINEIATDGLSELLQDKINSMDEITYKLWLNYHLYTCEKPEFIGFSNHLLFIAKK